MSFQKELDLAIKIVQTACKIAESVADSTLDEQTMIKKDRSPVTVGDYSVQAYVNKMIKEQFPTDKIIAEESTKEIEENILTKVIENVNKFHKMTKEEIIQSIDQGACEGGQGRYWILDPIDGTLGYLRREQYAVCLGFMVDGELKVGVLGCPNYEKGTIIAGQKGCGVKRYSIDNIENGIDVHVTKTEKTEDLCFCESVEASHSDHGKAEQISKTLGVTKESVRMDSQAKYLAVATGKADVYLRLPRDNVYCEKVWDHSAGYLLVKEAGGKVTDIFGKDLDFTVGRTLKNNRGIICTNGLVHDKVVAVVSEAFKDFK